MNIVAAKVGGVREGIVCIPPMPDGTVPVATLRAADIIAQLEHGPKSSGFLLTTSAELAHEVEKELNVQREAASRKDLIDLSGSAILVGESLDECIEFINDLAPAHLELMV